MNNYLYKLYLNVIGRVRRSRLIHQFLFGYCPCPGSDVYGGYWDWTTLLLKRALQHYLRPDIRFLDMGTGSAAVLSMFAKLRFNCKTVYAVDYVEEILSIAKKNAASLGLDIKFNNSNLFSNIEGCFDVIAFNAPYLNTEKKHTLGLMNEHIFRKRFCGGQGGGETVAAFLQGVQNFLSSKGVVMLGVNHHHISQSKMRDLISNSDLELCKCLKSITGSAAYILRLCSNS